MKWTVKPSTQILPSEEKATTMTITTLGVYSKEIINMLFVGQVSGFVKNFNIVIF